MDPLSLNIRPEVRLAVVILNDVFHVNQEICPPVTKQFWAATLDPIMDMYFAVGLERGGPDKMFII